MLKKILRKGVFIATYKVDRGKRKYLILHRKLHWKGWEFPKGGIEEKERLEEAARRELREETGLRIKKIKRFNISGKYKYAMEYPDRKGFSGQSWKLFSAEVFPGKVKIDRKEHDKSRWIEFEKAEKILTWENQRRCLRRVEGLRKYEN